MIEVKDLVKVYGEHVAVDHLSFNVEKGHIYGLLGPNGAGKTTTMNMLTGYIGPTEGSIYINGHNLLEEPEAAKKCIGYLPEQPPLYMDMTPREYLSFSSALKGVDKKTAEKALTDVMKTTGIEHVGDRLIKNLSKGYRQRVGLAQALIGYPEFIILDEPTVGLDPAQIIEIRELIRGLGKKHTVILSSHILSEISAVCDDVLILSHGRLVACDTTEKLSRMTQDEIRLNLTVRGRRAEIIQAIEGMTGVQEVQVEKSEENGCLDVMVRTVPNVDIREEIFYAMAEIQTPIYAMAQVKKSLEDVFIKLTSEEALTSNEEESESEDNNRSGKGNKKHKSEKKRVNKVKSTKGINGYNTTDVREEGREAE